ncbi:PapB/FocB family fimbrial expression transcriptional regulator [Escherichia coli]|nr:PapB/FocB family fimbrial expression transcriptional regulator [Escherichia coli]
MTKGNISERDFDILIKLSGIHSEKAILALKKILCRWGHQEN